MDYRTACSSVHGFPRQECWSGLPFPCPRDLIGSGIDAGIFIANSNPNRVCHARGNKEKSAFLRLYRRENLICVSGSAIRGIMSEPKEENVKDFVVVVFYQKTPWAILFVRDLYIQRLREKGKLGAVVTAQC